MAVRIEKRRGARRYVIDIHYRDGNGKRRRFRRDAEVQTLRAARAEDRRRLAAVAAQGDPDGNVQTPQPVVEVPPEPETELPAVTFAEAAEQYLEVYGNTRLKPSTKHAYSKILEGFLLPRIGDELLGEIDATTVRRLDGVMVRRKVTANTRRQFQCVLRSVCRWAVEAGLLAEAPVWPKLPKMNGTVQVFLTEEDLLAILAVTRAPYRLGFELAAYAGLRAGEVRGLRWMHVDLERGFLVVRRSIARRGVDSEVRERTEGAAARPTSKFAVAGAEPVTQAAGLRAGARASLGALGAVPGVQAVQPNCGALGLSLPRSETRCCSRAALRRRSFSGSRGTCI